MEDLHLHLHGRIFIERLQGIAEYEDKRNIL